MCLGEDVFLKTFAPCQGDKALKKKLLCPQKRGKIRAIKIIFLKKSTKILLSTAEKLSYN